MLELERYEDAIASLDTVTQLKSDSPKAWDSRGYALLQLGRDKDAIASFNRALKIKPDYASAHYNKATCYALRGEADMALESLQKAIDLNPKYRKEAQADTHFSELSRDDWFQEITDTKS